MLSLKNSISLRFIKQIVYQRYASTQVRVRFAPSPTGHLHLGGLRTALYNYLYARHQNGKFLLRIEDTDQTRLVPGAMESLIEDLQWAGIEIDEGPGSKVKGSYGPYIQSQRTKLYLDHVETLLQNGSAYRCFCTERRLELLRKEALRTRQVPKYDNKCRHLSQKQIAELLGKSAPFCIRFKLNDYEEPLNDLIYGPVHHNVSQNEGDPVIMKSDQFPTYHFANVVDDHMMAITHVFRGVEWQISTTKHLLLYRAFGWEPPKFGHLPLLVNADGTKLSKRQGDIGIKSFREKGYFPTALLNYVVSAGGGFPHEQFTKLKVYSLGELSEKFTIENVNSHPSRLNPDLLDEFNRLQIIDLLNSEDSTEALVENVQHLVKTTYPTETNLDLNSTHILNILKWSSKRLTFIKDLTAPKLSFLWVKPTSYKIEAITKEQMGTLIESLEKEEFEKDHLNSVLKNYCQQNNVKFPTLMKCLRSALSGLKEGPGVAEMMEILGKRVTLQRLSDAVVLGDADGRNMKKGDRIG
ncbi:probable glutamate--tRNA ligase, mitochondrial isoform X2 [Stomoxys calcitrans]|uniref:probable glutamate--tRNA ligase, mitochondrial isoform X2 n=2 Tax=Stomoxys calcitrans TaxID=35570 RepID=UPI0027E279F4|nr:probable glutamate--tRNA ligase, mitochondrial isoform X2 [Stomoxys calcitrans]